jgi:Skp family chaperone for outer membrane proteins
MKTEFCMNMKTLIAVLALSVGGMAMAQTAAPATPKLDKREANQQARIDQGVASGQLNAKETNRLDKREAKLNADEAAAKADGKVTRAERRKLEREANRDSKAIHKQKHDKQTEGTAK